MILTIDYHTVILKGILTIYCHTVILKGILTIYCHTVILKGILTIYCHTVILKGILTIYCHTVILKGYLQYSVSNYIRYIFVYLYCTEHMILIPFFLDPDASPTGMTGHRTVLRHGAPVLRRRPPASAASLWHGFRHPTR